ncbi:MAG TPA: hypothetical protein VH482_19485 [Thermomicrobiales bacterium]|jgi:hypothetical protein
MATRHVACRPVLLLSLVALAVLAVRPAAAQGLTPPPPPYTTCTTAGSGTTCRGNTDTTFSFPAEFACGSGAGSFAVDEQGTTHREATLWYDRAGNLTKRTLRIAPLEGTFTNAATGRSVPESAHFVITHELLTPGDLDTDRETIAGLFAKVVLPGGGSILLDVGKIVYDPDGDIAFAAGPHQFTDGQVAKLCAALS